jgi:hypothetical protein
VLGQTFHIFMCVDAMHRGDPTDTNESTKIEWFSPTDVRELLKAGEITDGLSFGALTFAMATGAL